MNTEKDTQLCAHEGCICSLNAGEGIVVDGAFYCSSECAQGLGCSHEGCDCANQ